MYLGAAPARHFKTEADLNAFHRLNTHERLRQPAIELTVPLRMTTESGRQSQHYHFKNTSKSIAFLLARFDQGDHFFLGGTVRRAHGRLRRAGINSLVAKTGHTRFHAADGANVAHHANAEGNKKLLGEGAHRRT